MVRQSIAMIATSGCVFLLLVACDQMNDAQNHEAEALRQGNAAVAACIVNQCDVLDIDGMLLDDYAVINDLTHVTVLMASRTSFANLGDIASMHQLKELHISYSRVSDLTGLQNFPQLNVLHLEGVFPDVNIEPIAGLTQLTELALGYLDARDDVSFIRDMHNLENLVLEWQGADADLSALRSNASLRNLEIRGNLPEDQSALLTMPNLEAIKIESYRLDDNILEELQRRGIFEYGPTVVVC